MTRAPAEDRPRSLRAAITEPSFRSGVFTPARGRGTWEHTSYEALIGRARAVGRAVAEAGAGAKPVAVVARSNIDLGVGFLGALAAGALPVLLRARRPFEPRAAYVSEVGSMVASIDAAALVVDAASAKLAPDLVRNAPTRPGTIVLDEVPEGDDRWSFRLSAVDGPAFLQFTSGSSGRPKPVAVTWANLDAAVGSLSQWIDVHEGDGAASWLPLYHDMGLIGFFVMPVVHDAPLWLLSPDDFLRHPVRWIEAFAAGATIAACPTFGLRYCTDRLVADDVRSLDVSRWRVVAVGAERVVPTVLRRFYDLLAPCGFRESTFLPAYGLAEATLGVSGRVPGARSRAVRGSVAGGPGSAVRVEVAADLLEATTEGSWVVSCGRPMPGCRVRIVDGDGGDADDGVLGEIAVKSGAITAGWPGPPAPAELFTGDIGFIREGELFVVGRAGDSVSVNGRVLYAEHIEVALAPLLPEARFAVVLGSFAGHESIAVVVETREASEVVVGTLRADVEPFLRARVGSGVAIRVEAWRPGSLPLTSSGKPRRHDIWRMLDEQSPCGEPTMTKGTS